MFSGTAQVSHQVCQFFFFVSSVCLLVRVTMVDKNKAVVLEFVVCRLLFASHIGHNVIRKEEKKA
jgi:DMSO reductase anchor subunit